MVAAVLVAVVAALLVSDAGDAVLAWFGQLGVRRADRGLVQVVISLRYHAVSIAAVFLALAVGVVLGAGGVSDRLLSAATRQADGLDGQVQTLTAERDGLLAAQRGADEFAARIGPAAVRGLLAGKKVAFVSVGADPADRDALGKLLGDAGATVSGELALTPAVGDPARADQLRELTSQLLPTGAQLPAASDTGSLVGGLLGGVLLGPTCDPDGGRLGAHRADLGRVRRPRRPARSRPIWCWCSPAGRCPASTPATPRRSPRGWPPSWTGPAGPGAVLAGRDRLGRRHRGGRGGPRRPGDHRWPVHRGRRADRRRAGLGGAGPARAARRAGRAVRHRGHRRRRRGSAARGA